MKTSTMKVLIIYLFVFLTQISCSSLFTDEPKNENKIDPITIVLTNWEIDENNAFRTNCSVVNNTTNILEYINVGVIGWNNDKTSFSISYGTIYDVEPNTNYNLSTYSSNSYNLSIVSAEVYNCEYGSSE